MEYTNLPALAASLREFRDKCILPYDQDFMITICGFERTSKSTVAMYLGQEVDPNFTINNICFRVEEYIRFLKNSEYFKTINTEDGYTGAVKKGSVVVYDEGGTQAYARDFKSVQNIELNKIYIGGGALNLIHIICVPKPVALDVYPREERSDMLIYTFYKMSPDYKQIRRFALVYSKKDLNFIYSVPQWSKYFRSSDLLRKRFHPTGMFEIPNLKPMMNPALWNAYQVKKREFSQDLLTEGMKSILYGKKKAGVSESDRDRKSYTEEKRYIMIALAERMNEEDFCKALGKSTRQYKRYRAKADLYRKTHTETIAPDKKVEEIRKLRELLFQAEEKKQNESRIADNGAGKTKEDIVAVPRAEE